RRLSPLLAGVCASHSGQCSSCFSNMPGLLSKESDCESNPLHDLPPDGGCQVTSQCPCEAICSSYCAAVSRWSSVAPGAILILMSHPLPNGSPATRAGSSATVLLTSRTSPLTGAYRSLTALTD